MATIRAMKHTSARQRARQRFQALDLLKSRIPSPYTHAPAPFARGRGEGARMRIGVYRGQILFLLILQGIFQYYKGMPSLPSIITRDLLILQGNALSSL